MPVDPLTAWALADQCAFLEDAVFEACLGHGVLKAPFASDGIIISPRQQSQYLRCGWGTYGSASFGVQRVGFTNWVWFGWQQHGLVPLSTLDRVAHSSPHAHGLVLLDARESVSVEGWMPLLIETLASLATLLSMLENSMGANATMDAGIGSSMI